MTEGYQPDRPLTGGPPGPPTTPPSDSLPPPVPSMSVLTVPEVGRGPNSALVHFADGSMIRVRYEDAKALGNEWAFHRDGGHPGDDVSIPYAHVKYIEWEAQE